MSYVRLCLVLVLVCISAACGFDKDKDAGVRLMSEAKILVPLTPDFTWASYQRFWHRGAESKVYIDAAKPTDGGYTLDYGYGVTLQVALEGDLIRGATLHYAVLDGNDVGGLQFLRMMRHMLRIGTYRWDNAQREKLFAFYEIMSPQMKEFYYKTSYFIRNYDANTRLWTFKFYFAKENLTVRTEPPLNEGS